jgi:hypothetical protein
MRVYEVYTPTVADGEWKLASSGSQAGEEHASEVELKDVWILVGQI